MGLIWVAAFVAAIVWALAHPAQSSPQKSDRPPFSLHVGGE